MSKFANLGRRGFELLKSAASNFSDDGALRLSAALAYYSIFSIAPLLIIAMGVAGLALGPEAVEQRLQTTLQQYVGADAAATIQGFIKSTSKPSTGVWATIIGFVTLMLGASGVFGQLKDALNLIWEVKVKSAAANSGIVGKAWGLVRERLWNFGMVLVVGFLLLVSLLATALLAGVTSYLNNIVPAASVLAFLLNLVLSVGVVTVLFAMIFKVLPDVKIEWRDVWLGAGVTAVLFELGKFGLSIYLGKGGATSGFGAAGSVVLLLLWVYYASCILFFGAEFTQVYAQAMGRFIQPEETHEKTTGESEPPAARGPKVAVPQPAVLLPDAGTFQAGEAVALRDLPTGSPAKDAGLNPAGYLAISAAVGFIATYLARRAHERPRTRLE